MDKAVIVEGLQKKFSVNVRESGLVGAISSIIHPKTKIVEALKNISFTLQKGELVGFIGPNGAGKTTTMKVLSGLLYPDAGFVSVAGFNPWDKKHKFLKKISLIMGQKNQLWWDLPAIDSFELNKEIYQIPEKEYQKNLSELVEILSVGPFLKTQVRKLSLGQRMKMELIAALIYKPEILFLDEPTIGLDLVAQQSLRDFIFQYNRKNESTILLTSHNMADLVDLARRTIVINNGEIIFDGLLDELSNKYAKDKIIKIVLSDEIDIKEFEGIGKIVKYEHPNITIAVPRATVAFVASEILQKYNITDLTISEMNIEDVIRQVFK